ncbi:MAG TPA: hypothetical protein VFQ16_15315 [Burkholderiaceae bacterium]|nr:hypothetical protein [Burkholderiaceae bacterium]
MSALLLLAGVVAFAHVALLLGGAVIGLSGCAVGAARAVRRWSLRTSVASIVPMRLVARGVRALREPRVAVAAASVAR